MCGEVSIITYADFGQNMGRYRTADSANALLRYLWGQSGGVTIQYADGTESAPLEGGMINFTGVSDNGAFMAIGYNATASVQHNGVFGGCFTSDYIGGSNAIYYQGIEYRIDSSETFLHSPHGGYDGGGHDYKVTRMSKVITDVIPATVYSGTSADFAANATGQMLYHTGAGNMGMYVDGSPQSLVGAYTYLVGGADTISAAWTHGSGTRYSAEDAALYTFNTAYSGLSSSEPLPYEPQQGDSGSPVFVFNNQTGQYEYVGAVQSIGGGVSNYRGGADYTKDVLGQYDKVVTADGTSTLHITAVNTAGDTVSSNAAYDYGMEQLVSTTPYSGTVTDASGKELTSFVGVKSGINTWLDLSAIKDTDNWYNYNNTYLNAAPYIEGTHATSGKDLSYGDLFLTENLVFAATAATNNIVLDAAVDLGIGYAQFCLGEGQSSASFNISSGGDGSYQFNHAGYVIDRGVSVHTTLTGAADHMYEWRKVGAGDLYIEGSGNNNILLNVGGAGKTFLNRTNGYAAYNALVNTYATVVISDVNQIYRDLTFGHQGGVLDFSGNSMSWNNDNAASADGFTIHALDDSAIIANLASGTTTTLTWTQSGNQSFLGSFADNGNDSALKFVYNGGTGASLTLNSIKTHLTVAGSGMEVQSGKLVLVGTNTVHAPGSASGKNANRYTNALDWHYADAASDVTVKNGATFELGSHARLTGNVTVESGGTFIMREGVQHAQEYIEGGVHLQSTADIAAYYGLKGNVSLASGATMQVLYNSGVTVANEYAYNITGAGNVSIDLGDKAAEFILSGTNTFSGTKAVEQGVLVASTTAALGDTTANKWILGTQGTLVVLSGLTADNALSYVDGSSTGTLALHENMAGVLDMSNHSDLFVGAVAGKVVEYGTAESTLGSVGGKWNLGGGGGELVVNALLNALLNDASAALVLGNGQGLGGIVTLTNSNNNIGSITFNEGVILSFENAAALGGANIDLSYAASLLGSADTAAMLQLVNASSSGSVLLDRTGNADVNLSTHGSLSLGSAGDTTYSGNISVAENAAYRFGGGSGTLTLTNALRANGANNLVVDGQTQSGGKLVLAATSDLTGAISVMGYDSAKTSSQQGDMTLAFTVDNALASASSLTVHDGGIVDLGTTTQTFTNVQVLEGGVITGAEGSTLVFHMTEEKFQYGSLQLANAEKTGSGNLVLAASGNSWDLLTIKQGTVFTRADNALSATGITRVENGGVLNMNTWNEDGFRSRTMNGNVLLADGGKLVSGTGTYDIYFNGSLDVESGAVGTVEGGYWHLSAAQTNMSGGTLSFNSSQLHLAPTYAQHFGGTVDIAASSTTIYSEGEAEDMLKHFNHINIASGKALTLEDATWNTIWQLDKLSGAGSLTWNSDTTHNKTARLIIGGDGEYSGVINFNRNSADSARTHQAFLEINGQKAASGATLNMNGNANSFATLAVNADAVRLGGVNGDEYSHIMAGAAPTNAASTTAPASTRDATLILTGSGSYTYSGSIGTTADTASASLSLSMQGSGSQTINGTTVVLNDISALSGSLSVSANSFSLLGDVTVAQGATLKLGDAFSLDSGHTFYVQGSDNASTATFGSALTLNSGTLCFDASDLSTTSGTYSLALSTASGNATLNFNNSGSLSAGTYYLASGDWTGAALTMDAGMDFMSATINNSANGLTLTLAIHSDSDIWNGTDSAYGWSLSTFGSSNRSQLTGTAVFNDLAANKTVNVTETQNLKALRFDSKDDYAFSVASEKSVTATNLYQLGSGTTTLSGTVNVTGTMIEAGSLVVTGTAQSLGTVSGEGELVIDWGANTSGTVNISDLGTLHIKTGSYGSESAAAINVDTIIVDAGATYVQGANIAQTVNLQTAGTVSLSGGSNWNSLIGTVALTGDATFMNRSGFSFIAGGIQGNNHKLIVQGVFSTAAESTGLVLKAQASNISATEVQSGVLMLGGELYHDGTQMGTISVANGAALRMAYGTGLGNATIHLQSGAELQLYNGSGGSVELNGNLTVADGAKIRGAYYGGNARMTGTISGSGTLTLTNEQSHRYYINSSVKDAADAALALKIADGSNAANVQIGGSNTYSGGTTLESGSLTTANSSALGTGNVQINGGTLTLAENLSISTLNGSAGTLDFAGNTLTVGAHGASADASYSGALTSSVSTAGSITKQGSNTQSFTAANLELQDITVEAGTLSLSDVAAVAGNITVQDGASLSVADGSITLGEGQTLAVLSGSSGAVTLNALVLAGGNIVLSASGLSADSAALSIASVTGDVATSITLAGMVDLADGKYLLAAGDWSAVEASLFSLGFMAKSAELNPSLSTDSQGLWLTLASASDDSSNVWAGTDSAYEWNSTTFSQYSTSDALAAEAIFDATAANKSVNVTSAVSTGTVTISSGGYSFSGEGSISTGTLSVSGGGSASSIANIEVSDAIVVDGSELTIVELTPVNPSAPITLSNAAKLTIGSTDYRYSAFSGKVTGDDGSQLHLYTTQVSDTYWQQDGTVQLLDGSTVQDVYIHGDLALNIIEGYQGSIGDKFTNVQGANLHMDAGSQLVVRAEEGTGITPTTGNIVLGGDLSIVAYSPVTTATSITSHFTQESDATTSIIKKDIGSLTLSGNIDVDAIEVQAGTLQLTGSSIASSAYSVAADSTLVFSGAADSAAASSALVNATGEGNLVLDDVDATWNYGNVSDLTGQLTIRNATLTTYDFNGDVNQHKTDATANLSSFTSVLLDNAVVQYVGATTTLNNVTVTASGAEFNIRDMGTANVDAINFEGKTTLQGTLTLSTTGWKSQINIASLTGAGNLDIVGAGEYVRVKLSATDNYTGNVSVSGNLGRLILENSAATSYGSAGSTVTLSGSNLFMNGTGALTLNSQLVVNNSAATADAPSTSILRNDTGVDNMERTLSSVSIAAHNTLELQQFGWNTIWNINDLTGEGNLTWSSTTTHHYSSRLVLSGDNDFSGNITLNRSVDNLWGAGAYQAFIELASDGAAKNATLSLIGKQSNQIAVLTVNTDNAQIAGLSGNSHAYVYAGQSATNSAGSDGVPVSTAANTLTIAGAGDYTFAGTVGTSADAARLSLAMTGEGKQTFSGQAYVGNVSVSKGELVLNQADVDGSVTVSGGALNMTGSTYTLGSGDVLSVLSGTEHSVQLGNLTLSGGEMVFDASLLNADTSALSVGTVSLAEGTSSQLITFNNIDNLESGRYLLSDSWTAVDGLSFSTGTLAHGTANVLMQDGALYLDYTAAQYYTWTGAADGNWNYSSNNWDNTPDIAMDDSVRFIANRVAIFETDANVTVSEAVSADSLIVRNGATLNLTETAALTVNSIEVTEASKLIFNTASSGSNIGANIVGEGTVVLTLSDVWDNKITTGAGFTGEVHLSQGRMTLDGSTTGSKLVLLTDAADIQLTTNKSSAVSWSGNIELQGEHDLHSNSSTNFTFTGSVTGTGTYVKQSSGTLTFDGYVDLGEFRQSAGATYFEGDTKIETLSISGGSVTLKNAADGTGKNKFITNVKLASGGAMYASFAGDASEANGQNVINLGTLEVNGTGRFGVERSSSCWQGTINIANLTNAPESASSVLTLTAGNQVNNVSVINLNGGSFVGTIKVEDNSAKGSGTPNRKFAVNINDENVAAGAIIQFVDPSTATDTDKAYNHIALGLGSTTVVTTGLSGETTNAANIYAYQIKSGDGFNNKVNESDTAARTLILNVTSETPLTTNAIINGGISLVKTGAGSQTISGVATVGNVAVQEGALVLSNASSTISGDITMSGGQLDFGGSYTLGDSQTLSVLTGTENAVQLGGMTLSGGQMLFDASLLSENSAALSLGSAAVYTAGTTQTITLDFSKLTGALANGSYKLASGDWSGANNDTLTYNGIGSASFNATADGLYLVYTNDGVYTWVGGAADTNWSSANWDIVPDTDAGNNLSFAAGKDAIFNSSATAVVSDAVTAGTVYIMNGAEVTWKMEGEGASLTFAHVDVVNGKLSLHEQTSWTGMAEISVRKDGTLVLNWGTGLAADKLLLQGGTIELRNGGGTYHELNTAITVDGSGWIKGSSTGNSTVLKGSITGTGTLYFEKINDNPIKIESTMTDGAEGALSVNIGDANIVYAGANLYTGTTSITGGTLELAGAVSMAADGGAIDVASGATLLLNTTQELTLGNDITGQGTIHQKGGYGTVLAGNVTADKIELADTSSTDQSWENNLNAGVLTLTGETVNVGTVHAGYGTINIGGTTEGDSTFMQTGRFETGDSNAGGTTTVTINAGSTLTVTGNSNVADYKTASLILGEWNYATDLTVRGTMLAKDAKVLVGDNAANIVIDGGVLAVNGFGVENVKSEKTQSISIDLKNGGSLILGDAGISTDKAFSATFGEGTVGMSAASTTIAENVTLNSTEGTTFDTTQYTYETNAEGVATDIVRGDEGGDMVLSGDITSADGVAASMKVTGAGTLHVAGSADVRGNVTVEQGAGMAVSTVEDGTAASMATISSADGSNAASISGGVRLSHADAAVSIAGSGMDITEISNSLIALQQGVSLNMNNLHIAAGTQVQGYHAATAASGVMLLDGEVTRNDVALADVSLEISKANAVRGADGANTQAAKVMMLSSSAFSYSSLTGTLTVEFSGEFAHELLAGGYDAVGLSFTETEFDTTAITILGMYEGISGSVEGYFDTSAGGNAVVYFSTDIIPEPATSTLGLLALAALAYRRRRK